MMKKMGSLGGKKGKRRGGFGGLPPGFGMPN